MNTITEEEHGLIRRADTWLAGHREEFIRLLRGWVAIPSICDESQTDAEHPLGSAVNDMFSRASADMRALGVKVDLHDGYAISMALDHGRYITGAPIGGDDEIGMVGHLDVVPAGDGWTHQPFSLELDDRGFAYGRGVADCKGPSLVDLCVLRMMHDLEVPLRHRLRVILGGGEETSMNDLKGYLKRYQAPGFSLVTDGPFPVNYGQKGILQLVLSIPAPGIWNGWQAGSAANAVPGEADILIDGIAASEIEDAARRCGGPYAQRVTCATENGRVRIHAKGEAGHAAFQNGTLNAIGLLSGFLEDSNLLVAHGRAAEHATAEAIHLIAGATDGTGLGIACTDESGPLSFNLGIARPNRGARLALVCDSRYPVGFHGNAIIAKLQDAVASFPTRWDVRIDEIHDEPAYRIDPNGVEATTLSDAFDAFFNTHKPAFTMGGGTHSRLLPRSVTFGADFWYMDDIAEKTGIPGKPDGMDADHGGGHTADECVNIDHLMTAAKLYMLAVSRLDKVLA